MDELERKALSYLPCRLREAVMGIISHGNEPLCEIRLRENRLLTITLGRRHVSCGVICLGEEIGEVIIALCGGSLYSFADPIREGVIPTKDGIRAGVCGRAVVENGRIRSVRDIGSVNIRIPHRIFGAADGLLPLVLRWNSVLLFAPPGMGKTTVLRELIPRLSGGSIRERISVIDTRYELCAGVEESETADIFWGYPRREGILAAVRTMSPRWIVCDEIGEMSDAEAILHAHTAGVGVIATAHGRTLAELRRNGAIAMLLEAGVFGCVCGLTDGRVEVAETNGMDGEDSGRSGVDSGGGAVRILENGGTQGKTGASPGMDGFHCVRAGSD